MKWDLIDTSVTNKVCVVRGCSPARQDDCRRLRAQGELYCPHWELVLHTSYPGVPVGGKQPQSINV